MALEDSIKRLYNTFRIHVFRYSYGRVGAEELTRNIVEQIQQQLALDFVDVAGRNIILSELQHFINAELTRTPVLNYLAQADGVQRMLHEEHKAAMQQEPLCSRTSCQRRGAVCKHRQNGQYYCVPCARLINEHNPIPGEEPLVDIPNLQARSRALRGC